MAALRRRRLGRTGLMVTELGLGAMDTPTSAEGAATIEAALDHGIDFIDTAREYAGSEQLIGQVLRARGGDSVHVATKTFSRTINSSQWDVDRSLRTLGVDRIALYQLHDVSTPEAWKQVMGEGGALEGLKVAQFRGLVGHIGISSHDLGIAREAILSGEFDTIMLEYSAFYRESAPLIELAGERDIGVIIMRPLGGSGRTTTMRGRIAGGYDGPLTPANLLRYVLSNPGISVAIPGARYPSRIHDNVATALSYEPMDEAERRALERAAAELY
ncbi:MAG: hypothetical protein Kow0010_18460 [Dehalococcoidia bacterium]